MGLQRITSGLKGIKTGCKRLEGVTGGYKAYKGLQGPT